MAGETLREIGGVKMIHLSGLDSNIYLFGKTVIDTGTGFNFVRLMDILKQLKIGMNDIELVVNTHCHFDHTGGDGYFPKAKIAIHEADADAVEKADEKMVNAGFFDGKARPKKISQKLKEGDIISGLKVFHTPGHTPGSICLLDEKKKILFSGDTIFSDGVGRTDRPGGNEEHLEESINRIMELDFDILLPGHGEPIIKNAKRELDKMLSE
ncbi:MAG: MBL fold metallo-hydrolase [Candidatus Aenigmarchaeota archaeon]|nr:MBL fold metallo-hydrolase [Candidatus Aenigmarchaeota archaeon]